MLAYFPNLQHTSTYWKAGLHALLPLLPLMHAAALIIADFMPLLSLIHREPRFADLMPLLPLIHTEPRFC